MSNKSKIEICANSVESAVKHNRAEPIVWSYAQVFPKEVPLRRLAKYAWHANSYNRPNCTLLSVPVAEIFYILHWNKKSCCMILK